MTKTLFALSFLALTGTLAFSAPRPRMEFVADEATAVKIAIAAWEDAYGAEKIEDQKPFSAVLRGSVWQVQPSSLRREFGGRLYAEVVKADGTIRSIRLIK